MYACGDCRSETLLPCASRSRSRWRIFSRSKATAFMRLDKRVGHQQRHRQRQHRRAGGDRGEHHRQKLRIEQLVDHEVRASIAPQKSKLIILRITRTPMIIQIAEPASITRPIGSVHKQLDVLRAGEIDERHHRDRQRADDRRRGLRLHRHGLDLGFHLLAVAQHARKIAERFGEIAAGALLDGDDDAEEVRFRRAACVRRA